MSPQEARRRFAAARVARLATADVAGRPHLVPITFVVTEPDVIYSAVDAKPKRTRRLRRLDNVEANPHVSLVVDHYDEDWARLAWVIVEGRAVVLRHGTDFGRAVDLLTAKYPQYRTMGLDRQAGAVVAITPDRLLAWRAA